MGHSSKKKKRSGGGGGGKRNKGRVAQSKDSIEFNDFLSEEITALCAIFQEECKVVSESPPRVVIKIRPYSKDTGYENVDVSALLSVRCLPGYPYKCPKLQITPEKGLSKEDADKLLSLLDDQANSNAREGRVMIYNLVEAAQEFLSEIAPKAPSIVTVPHATELILQNDLTSSHNERGPFIYGFVDLFSGSGESWHWGLGMDGNDRLSSSVQSHVLDGSNEHDRITKPLRIQDAKRNSQPLHSAKLDTLKEESEDDSRSASITESSRSSEQDLAVTDTISDNEDFSFEDSTGQTDDVLESSKDSLSDTSLVPNEGQAFQIMDKDLVMIHLLRLGCASKGELADAMPEIITELYNLGMFSERARDLATKPSPLFSKTFDHIFRQQMASSKISQFWKPISDIDSPDTSSPSSRYLNDFEELKPLGRGGFGIVVLCKNKLDGRQYAVKRICLKGPLNDRILREVATLSRLQHLNVVRYYQAWFETGVAGRYGDNSFGSRNAASASFSYIDPSSSDGAANDNDIESTYLYIQMEYCPRTLRQVLESYSHFDKELAWHLFRQIVEGLAHIHGQGIIHRDLTPNNIFFDARNDIKIGDFGLAKFLKLEKLDQEPVIPIDTVGVSSDGTGQIGTYFYTAPEIEQGWPKIDEKSDMYSLGVVFLELWHPFGTAMERHVVLSDLKLKKELPSAWSAEFPEQASLLRTLMSPSPSDRPSATYLLRNAFPPRMEYELIDNILRTMRTSEDTSVYEKVVNSIFDEELLSTRDNTQRVGTLLGGNNTSSIRSTYTDSELRDYIAEMTSEVFRQHCAKRLEILPMRLMDDDIQYNRNSVKLLTHGGDMLELCHELRLSFADWVITNQKSSLKRYEVAYVYRKAIGHSTPNRYLQGDFDIIGGASPLTDSEAIKVAVDVVTQLFDPDLCDIHINHGDLLDAIWLWTGIKPEHRRKVAELLSMMGSLRPQSSERKSKWALIRRQLLQELQLEEAVINRLQTVGLRFCGPADQALPRLRGALPSDKITRKALNDLSDLFSYLRIWKIQKHLFIDALMIPTEDYHRNLFFQIYLMKENNSGSLTEGSLLAIGGRYDYLLHPMWDRECKSNPPGCVGTSFALETMIQISAAGSKPVRIDGTTSVLVCSRGGGGFLEERMELVAELWEKNIKAQYVPTTDPSLTEQYEYANEHDIKCLVIITESTSQTGFVKVRHLELKKEKEVDRENLVKFLLEATSKHLRNPSIWNLTQVP